MLDFAIRSVSEHYRFNGWSMTFGYPTLKLWSTDFVFSADQFNLIETTRYKWGFM